MLKGMVRKLQISLLNSQRDNEYRDGGWRDAGNHVVRRQMISGAYLEKKKAILAGQVSLLDYAWTAIKCTVREIYWYRRQKKMGDWIMYNTPYQLVGRNVASSCHQAIKVDNNEEQQSVGVFYKLYDKAKQEIKDDRLRVGLELT
jgi:hypothetical protein